MIVGRPPGRANRQWGSTVIAEPQATPYDLSFRLGRFPVRVHPLFWVVTLLMGSSALSSDYPISFLSIWVAVVFVSILVHELGHAVAFSAFGAPARVWLYWFGGLAVSQYPPRRPGPMIAVSLAGPAAGFILAGVVVGLEWVFRLRETSPYANEAVRQLLWVNVGWGLVNLLPVLPLDGGQVCRDVCRAAGVRRPEVTALKVSVGTAAAVAVLGLMDHFGQPRELVEQLPDWLPRTGLYLPILFGFLAYGSYQALQMASRQYVAWDDGYDDTPPWRRR